mmetsp:Transcript_19034/g.38453  ORF Transcript_19034/g.38453 Transcript_19034/m.38453 type:complete len:517 (-) Transcript_19034:1632-3182(-)
MTGIHFLLGMIPYDTIPYQYPTTIIWYLLPYCPTQTNGHCRLGINYPPYLTLTDDTVTEMPEAENAATAVVDPSMVLLEGPLYTDKQKELLIRIPWFSGPISVLASTTIVFMILWDRKLKLRFLYQRLLLAMSIMDVMGSGSMSLGGILTGTVGTCEWQGFMLQFPVSVALYNLSLCVYYHLLICNEWKPATIKRYRVEICMHAVALLYPLGFGFVALAFDSFNPMLSIPAWCSFSETPYDCNKYDDVDCVRGNNYFYVQLGAAVLPTAVAIVGSILCMFRIWRKVRRQEMLMEQRYSSDMIVQSSISGNPNHPSAHARMVDLGSDENNSNNVSSAESSGTTNSLSHYHYSITNDRERTTQAAIQALLYTSAFLLTYAAPIVQSFTGNFVDTSPSNRTFFFATSALVSTFCPLQGLWNLLIYVRPMYRRIRKQHPEYSLGMRMLSVLLGGRWKPPRVAPSSHEERQSRQPQSHPQSSGSSPKSRSSASELEDKIYQVIADRWAAKRNNNVCNSETT